LSKHHFDLGHYLSLGTYDNTRRRRATSNFWRIDFVVGGAMFILLLLLSDGVGIATIRGLLNGNGESDFLIVDKLTFQEIKLSGCPADWRNVKTLSAVLA
jgi:hypothetical protein